MKKITTLLLALSITIISTFSPASADPKKETTKDKWPKYPSIESPAAILMDATTGTILYEKNIDEKHYPASTTKILTGIIALENASMEDTVTFSHNAVFSLESGSTHIGIKEGEKVNMEDCLYALLLASANEVANGIAEHVGGSMEGFADMMNNYAKEIGCKNSHFVNPSGLHDDDHYTTCRDLALIAQYSLKNKQFREIDKTKLYTIPTTNITDEERSFSNHHQMLMGTKAGFTQYKYDGCIGGKTGYTSKAGNTLVTFAQRDNTTLITVVMATNLANQYKDSCALMDYGFDNFTSYNISDSEGTSNLTSNELETFNRYFNISNYEDSISIDPESSIILPKSAKFSDAKKNIKYNTDITLVEGDNNIGTITYTYNKKVVGTSDITLYCTSESLTPILTMPEELTTMNETENTTTEEEESPVWGVTKKVITIFCIVVVLVFIVFISVVISNHIQWKRRRRSYEYRRREKLRRRKDDDYIDFLK